MNERREFVVVNAASHNAKESRCRVKVMQQESWTQKVRTALYTLYLIKASIFDFVRIINLDRGVKHVLKPRHWP